MDRFAALNSAEPTPCEPELRADASVIIHQRYYTPGKIRLYPPTFPEKNETKNALREFTRFDSRDPSTFLDGCRFAISDQTHSDI